MKNDSERIFVNLVDCHMIKFKNNKALIYTCIKRIKKKNDYYYTVYYDTIDTI